MNGFRWLVENKKEPKHEREQYGSGYYWRWIKPDPPTSDHADELPGDIFDQLSGVGLRSPWLYNTRQEAIIDAVIAYEKATEVQPNRSSLKTCDRCDGLDGCKAGICGGDDTEAQS